MALCENGVGEIILEVFSESCKHSDKSCVIIISYYRVLYKRGGWSIGIEALQEVSETI